MTVALKSAPVILSPLRLALMSSHILLVQGRAALGRGLASGL